MKMSRKKIVVIMGLCLLVGTSMVAILVNPNMGEEIGIMDMAGLKGSEYSGSRNSNSVPFGHFTENMGQVPQEDIRYYLTSGNIQMGFATSEVRMKIIGMSNEMGLREDLMIRITFKGSFNVDPVAERELSFKSNYFLRDHEQDQLIGVSNYKRIIYENLYPDIDLVYVATEENVKYKFIVHPGGDPSSIHILYEGIESLEIDPQGDLIIHTLLGDMEDPLPFTYQGSDDVIPCNYNLRDEKSFGFICAEWDGSKDLIIDPIITYSTLIGGSSEDNCISFTVDDNGYAYMTGWTSSTDFPATTGAYQTSGGLGSQDAWFGKLNTDGSAYSYLSYIAYSGGESLISMDLDSSGNIYLIGFTTSTDIPVTTSAFQSTFGGLSDAFIMVFSNNGETLSYCSYFGGSSRDMGVSIVVDDDHYYFTGYTMSSDMPTGSGSFDTTFNGGESSWLGPGMDGFVAKFAISDHSNVYSTFLGGTKNDMCTGITVDESGRAAVSGSSYSENFPTTSNAYDTTYNGCTRTFAGYNVYGGDFIVTHLAADGSELCYSTFFGGSDFDTTNGITMDDEGCVYFTGDTYSQDMPTTQNAVDTSHNGATDLRDGIVVKLDPSKSGASSLVYSTFIGGTGTEWTSGIDVDPDGNAYVTGYTTSSDLPVTRWAFCPDLNQNTPGADGFFFKINPTATELLYLTYVGGSAKDSISTVVFVNDENVYIGGLTCSSDFPVTSGAADTTYGGGTWVGDGFVMKLDFPDAGDMIDLLIEDIEELVEDEILNQGQGQSLIAKLNAAKIQLDKGNPSVAMTLVNEFIGKVETMVKTDKLTTSQGQELIDTAEFIKLSI
ncbi:MAG: SBBP repeat-containing protein [Thermoplasmatota archaeon]